MRINKVYTMKMLSNSMLRLMYRVLPYQEVYPIYSYKHPYQEATYVTFLYCPDRSDRVGRIFLVLYGLNAVVAKRNGSRWSAMDPFLIHKTDNETSWLNSLGYTLNWDLSVVEGSQARLLHGLSLGRMRSHQWAI